MSHLTSIRTRFQNLFYLEKALKQLNIVHRRNVDQNLNPSLIIPQLNGYDLTFSSNGQEYKLITDIAFWSQPYTIETFIDRIAEQYAGELVIRESQKIGFQPVQYKHNSDGFNTLVLERWNIESSY